MIRNALAVCLIAVSLFAPISSSGLRAQVAVNPGSGAAGNGSLAPLIEQVLPAVVTVYVSRVTSVDVEDASLVNSLRNLFRDSPEAEETFQGGIGSGVIVDADQGLVLTNDHVIDNADSISVVLHDRRRLEAELLGTDPLTDLALLKIPADDLSAIEVGDSAKVTVGDPVIAIGAPFGYRHSASVGIVSALGRTGIIDGGYEELIQTDAALNGGNSGGPLVDLNGTLIGVNKSIASSSGGNQGVGFAVSSNMAAAVMQHLFEHGDVQRASWGVRMWTVTPGIGEALELGIEHGSVISFIEDDLPAARAGLQALDVIVAINGHEIRDYSELRMRRGYLRFGDPIEIDYVRNGERRSATLVTEAEDFVANPRPASTVTGIWRRIRGADLRDLQPGDLRYGSIEGVLIASVAENSPAQHRGLRENDIVVGVNLGAVVNEQDLRELLSGQGSEATVLVVERNYRREFIEIQ